MGFRDRQIFKKKSEIWCSYTKCAPNFEHHNFSKKTAGYTRVNTVQFLYFLNAKIPASYYTGQFVSDLVGTQIVGFLTHRLKYKSSLSFYQSGDAKVKPPVFIVQANCCLHCHHLTNIIFSDLNRSHYYLKAIINVFIL